MHRNSPILLRSICISFNMEIFCRTNKSHEMHCQLCWTVASIVVLDSNRITDAMVCACMKLLRDLSGVKPLIHTAARIGASLACVYTSAGFRTGHTGHVPRGLHKKGPPQKQTCV